MQDFFHVAQELRVGEIVAPDGAEKRLRTAHEVDAASVKKVTRLT
jgi:hypothetical protein